MFLKKEKPGAEFDPTREKVTKVAKTGAIAAIAAMVLFFVGLNSFYTISEQEQAVLTTFGKATTISNSGLHFKVPFVQQVQKVDTTIRGMAIGYYDKETSNEEESIMITSDYNFVNVDFYVEYRVGDPAAYVYASQDPNGILKNIAQSCIRSTIGEYKVDDVLTTGKSEIQAEIRQMIVEQLEQRNIGLQLVNITIQDAAPPTDEVMAAFKAVETAKQGMETAINNANRYNNEKLPEAEAEANRILQEAEASKMERINAANAEVAVFNAQFVEYMKNPEITRLRMFYETMEELLPDLKIVISDGSGNIQEILPLDNFSNETSKTEQ